MVGTKGDSQCYLGVMSKVDAIHARMKSRIGKGDNHLRLALEGPDGGRIEAMAFRAADPADAGTRKPKVSPS